MATKKKIAKKSVKNFVVRFHSNLSDPDIFHDPPKFYSESGQGWVSDVGSATRYDSGGADKVMLELLKEEKVATELIDLNDSPVNLFSHNTVFTGPNNLPHIITKVPQFRGDNYHLGYHDPNRYFVGEDWSEEDLVDMIEEERFTVLWDPDGSFVPEDNGSWLNGLRGK